jgi:RNA polymerase sigma-70 factor (ECF subfamily)
MARSLYETWNADRITCTGPIREPFPIPWRLLLTEFRLRETGELNLDVTESVVLLLHDFIPAIVGGSAMNPMAGATTLGELASALAVRNEEASVIAELKTGSDAAYAWLIERYHQPIYSLVYRILNDPADAADTTQEVFIKVFRGIRHFNGESSLKTWMYRIALHEASNHRRWWFRHKAHETSIEPAGAGADDESTRCLKDTLMDGSASPFEAARQQELREQVEAELSQVPEPYRTTVVLRDLQDLSYEEIAEVMETTLGTVKSRLMRGRDALRKRLQPILQQESDNRDKVATGREVEVTP